MDNRLTIPLIQAARGIAVVLVMLFHTSSLAQKYFHINFLGVSGMGQSGGYAYFFVLTGFLMFTLYHQHFGKVHMWGTFMVKRLLRIYPLYWLVNAAVIPIYFIVPAFGNGYETKPMEIFTSLFLLPYSQVPILGVAWSLIYVVFFYFIFSLLFVLNKKTILALFTLWLLIVGLTNFGWIHMKDNVWLHFLFDGMHLQFVLGMLIAWTIRRFNLNKGGYSLAAGLMVFPIVWVLRYMNPAFAYPNVLYTIGSSLVLLGIGSMRTAAPSWLGFAQFLGNASYSILLTSLGFLSITLKLAKAAHLNIMLGPTITTVICFMMALPLCCIFYWYVERPLIQRLKSMMTAPAFSASTTR
ncbi:Peptidoglycan/LPS O-acetylase OafA/YrhL, contains acyltransferase and SGNH-hydrolase domains [Paenibacillus sp. 1_12]|uniref:acyltransferase family protein n=1 Tax=Paenibacillus sp. 1_12 TaxID=1566278 RepID=UPI0008EF8569|nr:acyltransferase [Paenibacillus sp. 1_12]SFL65255.1 Peptidoglycan/LPS O-acetylase OafA/YrhL, contains acyltransferase and SGNH-hydrolase domains [Paenibacillus sp. 1_12]